MRMPGGSNSPDSQRAAVRSSFPAMAAMQAAVLRGHKAFATTPNLPALTILSVPCRKCPPISVATATEFPNDERTINPRNKTQRCNITKFKHGQRTRRSRHAPVADVRRDPGAARNRRHGRSAMRTWQSGWSDGRSSSQDLGLLMSCVCAPQQNDTGNYNPKSVGFGRGDDFKKAHEVTSCASIGSAGEPSSVPAFCCWSP